MTPTPSQALSGSGRGHGCPRKLIAKPDYSDFPFGESHIKQEKWFRAKHTNVWWYNKLINEEKKYHSRKQECTLKYYYNKKKKGTNVTKATH